MLLKDPPERLQHLQDPVMFCINLNRFLVFSAELRDLYEVFKIVIGQAGPKDGGEKFSRLHIVQIHELHQWCYLP